MKTEENICGAKTFMNADMGGVNEREADKNAANGSAAEKNAGNGKIADPLQGKFKDVNALAEAYSALQAEFTRRSQRLRELEKSAENFATSANFAKAKMTEKGEKDARSATSSLENEPKECEKAEANTAETKPAPLETSPDGTAEILKNGKVAPEVKTEGGKTVTAFNVAYAANGEKPEGLSEEQLYAAASGSEAVRLKIIGDYLSSLHVPDAPLMRGGTGKLAVSPVKAKSIAEAGNMALRYFAKGGLQE